VSTELPPLSSNPHNPPQPPEGLGTKGLALWEDICSRYSLRIDELVLLEAAARTSDDIERLRLALVGAPLTVLGSQKQEVAHPLISEGRQLRANLAALLRQIALPDEDSPAASARPKSERHVRAATVRWNRRADALAAEAARADRAAL
jgi:hypothetical protein